MEESNNENSFLRQIRPQSRSSKVQVESTMAVLFQNQNKQVLQVCVPPNCSIFINGKVQYSNYHNPDRNALVTSKPFTFFSKPKIQMYQWKNKTPSMHVVGLTHATNKGPILFIDLSVYKESFYVDMSKIIASRFNTASQINRFPQIDDLILIEYKDKTSSLDDYFKNNQKIALQSSQPIIEKYLGVGEEFVIYQTPLVVSKTVSIEKIKADKVSKCFKFTGPGWVFFSPQKKNKGFDWKKMAGIIIVIVVYTITRILLYV